LNLISKSNLLTYLVFFYVLSYALGPAIINIYVTLLSIFGLFFLIKNKKISFLKIDLFFTLIIFYILIKEILISNFNYDFFSFLRFYIIFISINYFFIDYKINLWPIFFIVILISFDGLYQYFNNTNILGFSKYENYRLTGVFDDEPIIGSFLMKFFFPLFFATSILFIKEYKKIILYFFLFLIFLTVVISGERMPSIQIIIGSFFLILVTVKKTNTKLLLIFFLGVSIVTSYLFFNDVIKNRMNSTAQELITIGKNFNNIDNFEQFGSLKNYIYNFKSGIELWNNNPLFGGGYRFYNTNCSKIIEDEVILRGCSTHPHNIYIEIMSDHGLVGLFLFILFFLSILRKYIYFNNPNLGILTTFLILVFPFFTSQSIFSSYFGSIFFFFIFLMKLSSVNSKRAN